MSRPWMPFYPADFRMDTLDLTASETGVYVVMLMLSWQRGGPLSGDMKILKRMLQTCIADFHGHAFNAIVPKLLNRYFYQDENGDWRQKRIEKELEKADAVSRQQSQNASKRWSNEPQMVGKRSANGSQMVGKRSANDPQNNDEVNQNNDLVDAVVIPIQSQSQSQSQPHKNVVRARKRASRLPDDWILPDDYREAARRRGLADAEINRQADRMRNWSLSATGGAKLDWFRTWLNWIDSAPKSAPSPDRSVAFRLSKPAANF